MVLSNDDEQYTDDEAWRREYYQREQEAALEAEREESQYLDMVAESMARQTRAYLQGY